MIIGLWADHIGTLTAGSLKGLHPRRLILIRDRGGSNEEGLFMGRRTLESWCLAGSRHTGSGSNSSRRADGEGSGRACNRFVFRIRVKRGKRGRPRLSESAGVLRDAEFLLARAGARAFYEQLCAAALPHARRQA